MFTTTFKSFIGIGWTLCAPVWQTPSTPASTIVKILNFQNHCEHVYNNFWKFHRHRMNSACSCRKSATLGTPASTIFKVFKISKTTAGMFTTTWESFIVIGWTLCAPVRDRHTDIDFIYKISLLWHSVHLSVGLIPILSRCSFRQSWPVFDLKNAVKLSLSVLWFSLYISYYI